MSDHTAIFSNYVISEDTTNDLLVVEKKDTGDTIEIDGKSFDGGSGVTFEFDTTAGTTSLTGSANTLFKVNDGGPVEVLNTDLHIGGSYIRDGGGGRRVGFGSTATQIRTSPGDGTGSAVLYDEANLQNLLVANEGGPVEVLNSKLRVSSSGSAEGIHFPTRTASPTREASIWNNSSGEIQAVDEAGNTTTLT